MIAQRSNLAITIAPAAGASDLKLRASITQPVKKGVPIVGGLVAQGGSPPYVYSEVTSNLAGFGITLHADGTLTGSPTTVGLVTFIAQVQDAALGVYRCTFSIRVHANLKVVAGDPPDGEKAQTDYSYRFAISGATGTVTWSISPSLQFGHSLYFDTATGILDTGGGAIIGSTGTLNFTVTATDGGSGDSIAIPCSIFIYGELKAKLVSARVPIVVGVPTTISASSQGWQGGAAPFAVRFDTSTFPSGLSVESVNPVDGTITVLATESFVETLLFSAGEAVVTDSLGLQTNMVGTRLRAVSAVQPQSGGSDIGDFGISHLNVEGLPVTSVDGVMTIDGTGLATEAYVDAAVTGLLDLKGATNCSTNPNYPAASKGDAYIVSVAGKIGGASGTSVDAGDWYIALADNAGGTEASVGSSWGHVEHNLVGALLAANNLSDLASASIARTNLGLAAIAASGSGADLGAGTVANAALANMAAHTLKANITGSSAAPVNSSLSAILDAEVGGSDGMIIVRSGGVWSSLASPNDPTKYLSGTAVPSYTVPAATGGAGWVTALDLDLTAQSSQTLNSDTNYTIGGLTWTKTGSTNDRVAMALTNGTGLVITPKTTGTYNGTPTRTCPMLYTDLATIIPQFYLGAPFRIWYYMSADGIASSGDFSGVAIDNLSSSATTLGLGSTSRANSSGTRIIQYAGALGSSTVTSFNSNNNTDRVVVVQFSTGPIGGVTVFSGSYSSGWPAVTSIRPCVFETTANTALSAAQDVVTGLPMKLLIFGECTSGTPSYTYARIRVDYRVT